MIITFKISILNKSYLFQRRTFSIIDQQTEAVHRRQLTDLIEIKEAQVKELNDTIDGAKESMSSYESRLSATSFIQELRSVVKYLMNVVNIQLFYLLNLNLSLFLMKYIFISTKNKKVVFISSVLMNESKMKLVENLKSATRKR